jgi:hypothetical protein
MIRAIRYVLFSLFVGGIVHVGLSDLATTPTTHTGTQPHHTAIPLK